MTMTDETGVSFQILGALTASINGLSAQLEQERSNRQRECQALHLFTIPPQNITLTAGAGTLDMPPLLGPRTGKFWDVKRVSVLGYTAGTVIAYLGAVGAEVLDAYQTADAYHYGKAHFMLGGGDRIVFSATGITGTVQVTLGGIELDADCLGAYLS